jgi:cyclophilin family peptidyl-prolyl cis-trans isomerase
MSAAVSADVSVVRHLNAAAGFAACLGLLSAFLLLDTTPLWLKAAKEGNPRYRCHTTEGDFVVELFMDSMPLTASNFMDLADSGFYNGIHFHRVIDNFMVQFGCPFARHHRHPFSGTGGPPGGSTFRVGSYKVTRDDQGCIPDEFTAYISNVAGTLSMANKGDPNSGGSQIFINIVNNQHLDWWRHDLSASQHPVFAKVVEGWSAVRRISKALTDAKHTPIKPIRMISVTRIQ